MTGDARRGRQGRPADPYLATDPYATLGLPPGAPLADVKRAYRRLVKAFHPDSAGPAALPRFLAIHEAYERITTGRVLPGRGRPGSAASSAATPREPWRADPARARATRARASGAPSGAGAAATDGAAGAERRSGGGSRAAGDDGAAPRSGRRHATRKATLGSTTYDDARDRADATWSGASWYGPTTGEYWIINPREYADPRKHGPAYQARVQQQAGTAHAAPAAGTETAQAGPVTEASEAAADEAAADEAAVDHDGDPAPPETIHVRLDPIVEDETLPGARWSLVGGTAEDPTRRLRLALVAWPPLGVAAAVATGEVTGCAVAAASCTGAAPLLPWLAQVVILALLLLLPTLARLLSVGTVAILLAIVPATAVLLALGAGGRPEAGFALAALLVVAWLAGVAYGAIWAARRASLSSPG